MALVSKLSVKRKVSIHVFDFIPMSAPCTLYLHFNILAVTKLNICIIISYVYCVKVDRESGIPCGTTHCIKNCTADVLSVSSVIRLIYHSVAVYM